jgi:hypothetical protein
VTHAANFLLQAKNACKTQIMADLENEAVRRGYHVTYLDSAVTIEGCTKEQADELIRDWAPFQIT